MNGIGGCNINILRFDRELMDLMSNTKPVPINLISQQSIGASLGQDSLNRSLRAAIIGLIAIAIFMIF